MRKLLLPLLLALACCAQADRVTSPKEFFGHDIGADYELPNYKQLTAYWQLLAKQTKRMKLVNIGKTEEGRDQLMAIVSSPENMRQLDKYRQISERLSHAEGIDDNTAHRLARDGKAIVWIDGGLHASEVLCAQALMETLYQMVSGDDPETKRILDNDIILFVHANPDGMDLCSDWYMRSSDPLKRTLSGLPRLYQKYIGHDDNRDFYMVTQSETKNVNRVMYRQWYPQIVYNHHQTGPAGTVMFSPPFRDPFNYLFDPLIVSKIDLVSSAMHTRFMQENKPGVTMRSGSNYSTWWNGGLRTEAYFHNMVGILTETIGNPTPMQIPFVADKQVPKEDLPFPVAPQTWHFRQSIDYSVTANKAILDLASRYREDFLFDSYRMGKNSIQRGNGDHWTPYPTRIKELGNKALTDPKLRDPRAYVLPSDQPDFPTATKFINTLIENGCRVEVATSVFLANGKFYPEGSYVIRCNQAYRPHILDMFEPQDHPNDFAYPGGPPVPPYDAAGWTLAYQMGVQFVRVLDELAGPFKVLNDVRTPGTSRVLQAAAGSYVSHAVNNSFILENRLLKAGLKLYWLTEQHGDQPAGTVFIPYDKDGKVLLAAARDLGITFEPALKPEPSPAMLMEIRQPRIGLWDRYGGSMPAGWTRWILEQFEFPFDRVFAPQLDAGDLRSKYDVLIFVDGAISGRGGRGGGGGGGGDPTDVPEEYRSQLGSITNEKTIPQLKAFMEAGGTVITIGSSANLAYALGLPIESALVDEKGAALRSEKFYIPGSILQVKVDQSLPISWGMPGHVDVMFDSSPAFKLTGGGMKAIAGYDSDKPLRSGWAWGQEVLKEKVACAQASVGKGKLYVFGPEIAYRAQPHMTFKWLFNGIMLSAAR